MPAADVPATAASSAETAVAVASAPPFVIEKIVVEGVRHGSEAIVAAETLLAIGQSYTEKQLQQALHRVERLPFVVEADFALRKGTERGRFELVIKVVETMPIFAGGGLALDWTGVTSNDSLLPQAALAPELGGRLFFRGQNEVSLTLRGPVTLFTPTTGTDSTSSFVTDFTPSFDLAYTHHNLFGRHLVGSVSLGATRTVGEEHSERHERHGSAELALPLSRASILKARISLGRYESSFDFGSDPSVDPPPSQSSSAYHGASLTWQSDTTDDPFTPRAGRKLGATVSYGWSNDSGTRTQWVFEDPETHEPLESASDRTGLWASVDSSRFWPLSSRLSLGVRGNLNAGGTRSVETLTQHGSVRHGTGRQRSEGGELAVSLLGTLGSRPGAATRSWWELRGSLAHSAYDNEFEPGWAEDNSGRFSNATVSFGLALRGRWGIAHFGITYQHTLSSSYEPR